MIINLPALPNLHKRILTSHNFIVTYSHWKSIWEMAPSKAGANTTRPASKEPNSCSQGVSFAIFQSLWAPWDANTPIDHCLNIKGVGEKAAQILKPLVFARKERSSHDWQYLTTTGRLAKQETPGEGRERGGRCPCLLAKCPLYGLVFLLTLSSTVSSPL